MTALPKFASTQEYVSRLGDVGFWWPHVAEILKRHDLADAGREPVAGFNPTYPTFLCGDVVVKLFGYSRSWRESHTAERAAQALVNTDPEIDDYLARLGPFDRVFVHGDLTAAHAFVENGRLTGIIDWGDAMVTDRHYELIQLYRDTFGCDKELLRVFLEASDWPVGKDFSRQALGLALYRQAVGLAQHHTMDVFEPIAALLPLEDICTLDDLATELFAA